MEDAELIHEFVEEAREHLGDVETQLLQIEAMGANINDDLVNTVFRAIHSVKGAAGFLGLTQVNNVAHSFENVLGKVRDHQLVPDPFNVDVMLKAADRLRGLMESIDTSNETDNTELCEKLDALLVENAPATTETPDVPAQIDAIETAIEDAIEPAVEEEETVEDALVEPAADPVKKPRARKKATAKKAPAKKTATKKPAAKKPAAKKTTAKKPAAKTTTKAPASPTEPTPIVEPTAAVEAPIAAPAPAAPAPAAPANAAPSTAAKPSPAAESTIRVGVRVLDRLMNLAGELVLSRNQLLRVLGEHDTGSNLDSIVSGLDQVTTELQETIMQTRMQPIGNVFSKFTRVVRDLSGKLGKQCELRIEGKEVEIDKTIIELISDPLTHLVRNSVDHGVEIPDERIAAGKPAAGTLQLHAYHQSGKVRIEIVDDGKGINAAVLKEKAQSKGILTAEQAEAMGEREAVRLIFHPGFSTAQEVTDVSGRGVGMDVVRSNIEKLGGTVDIETQVGEGTTIVVTLPLTLAIVPSLIIQSGDDRFAIPQVNIAELVRIRKQESQRIEQVNNKEVLRLRGSLLPLVRLKTTLGQVEPELEPAAPADSESEFKVRHIIVVESGILRYGLVVDDVLDSEEIVVKPLGRHLNDCPCLSGATILGDGRVALILDVNGTAQQSKLRVNEEDKSQRLALDQEARERENLQSVLLFRNEPSEQFAVPMEVVARIERVESEQIVKVGSQELLHYRDGSLPLLRLENLTKAKPCPDQPCFNVIVFETGGHEVGVIASSLIDIREVPDQFDATTFHDTAVIGCQVIDEQTTRLLDTIELARKARPDWFEATAKKTVQISAENVSPTAKPNVEDNAEGDCVLLAEDSSFFRRQVKRFLEESGFDVVDCEDGREGWNTLKASPDKFRIVLTDIEMPNMDGLEFTRRIRSENRFADIPIIALTSLASQEDFQRGFDAGVTEYQVKLDRDELIAAIQRYATPTGVSDALASVS
ncbi:Chemotaxis protein CheA [Rubripirellula obstinata]|uniref:histidine kinase n=1 Tax=Rubripirellula obstinata TaxID=406547 RepID=A0A5B1CE96_9BACT|nr:chemotaxis protein CheW [Rubripirellula obstinata]KAA1257783.1 Chemotaxis protein CheA [Rubripirellula obstinata]